MSLNKYVGVRYNVVKVNTSYMILTFLNEVGHNLYY